MVVATRKQTTTFRAIPKDSHHLSCLEPDATGISSHFARSHPATLRRTPTHTTYAIPDLTSPPPHPPTSLPLPYTPSRAQESRPHNLRLPPNGSTCPAHGWPRACTSLRNALFQSTSAKSQAARGRPPHLQLPPHALFSIAWPTIRYPVILTIPRGLGPEKVPVKYPYHVHYTVNYHIQQLGA